MDYEKREIIKKAVEELKVNNPTLRDGSIKAYKGHIKAIIHLTELHEHEELFTKAEEITSAIKDASVSMNTKKAYLSVLCSLTRGRAINGDEYLENYNKYVFEFEDLKRIIDIEKIKQKPVGEEVIIKDLTMNMLHRALLKHKRDYMADNEANKESLMLYIVGLFHYHFTLRNELPTISFQFHTNLEPGHIENNSEVINKENYIMCYSRNRKELVINKNKVRDPNSLSHEARKEKIPKDLNWALNKFIKNEAEAIDTLLSIENSGYTKMVKRVWKHKGWELTSSLIRKLYACEIRTEHKGKLEYEIEACKKLDHSLGVHNTDYIVYFD